MRVGLLVQGPPIKGIFRDAETLAWALDNGPLRVHGASSATVSVFYTPNYAMLDAVSIATTSITTTSITSSSSSSRECGKKTLSVRYCTHLSRDVEEGREMWVLPTGGCAAERDGERGRGRGMGKGGGGARACIYVNTHFWLFSMLSCLCETSWRLLGLVGNCWVKGLCETVGDCWV